MMQNAVVISGVGIHSGARVDLFLKKCPFKSHTTESKKWSLHFQDQILFDSALSDFSVEAHHNTTLDLGHLQIWTPEHFLAALFFFEESVQIHCEKMPENQTFEFPLLDGSSQEWMNTFLELGMTLRDLTTFGLSQKFSSKNENRIWNIVAAPEFKITYELASWGSLTLSKNELIMCLNARTFMRQDAFEKAKSKGLLQGIESQTHVSFGILYQPSALFAQGVEILAGAPLRMEGEPLFHKILDFLGDLALEFLSLPRAHITFKNCGHLEHHQVILCLRGAEKSMKADLI